LSGVLYHTLKKGKVDTKRTLKWAAESVKWNDAMLTGREALSAKKIEDYIMPEVAREKQKRPKIGLHYGGFHFSMPQMLQSEYSRNSVLQPFEKDIRKCYFDEDLNKVHKAIYDGHKWRNSPVLKQTYLELSLLLSLSIKK
jgi:hypothetical protein